MKKTIISLFLIISVIGLSESDRETGITAERNETPVTQIENSNSGESTTDDGGETVENPEKPKTTAGFYEYRPEGLIQLDEQIKNPANRGSLGQLNARYEQELNAYLEMYSYDSDRIFYLANEYMLLNNYNRANKIFLKDNKDIKNVFGAATTYRFMGQNENAIQKYTEAISMNSNFAESYLGRGLANRNLDNYDSAVNDLQTYIAKTGAHDGYVALADVYFKMGKNKEAYNIASQGLAKYRDSRILRILANNILKNKID
ncbi:tetratricopeptide repeat protein [Fusobacterium simiae]|uniref:Tetratricopeptide repeat protein n=1 Tax=Fusobacterium simiae TaxID=855 RepID=A0ABT4DEN9_FUSSI|nr:MULTISPECIES: tetratricopeptide repeat protein [Fusobacterium]MCY7007063.1 tetratricopeptide repeat protein [Fusobacterium simiae]